MALCVMTSGTTRMPLWCVGNWDSLPMVRTKTQLLLVLSFPGSKNVSLAVDETNYTIFLCIIISMLYDIIIVSILCFRCYCC